MNKMLTLAIIFTALLSMNFPAFSQQRCTQDDLNLISRFDILAKRKLKEYEKRYEELTEDINRSVSRSRLEKSYAAFTEVSDFFQSEEFIKMEPIYERCNMEIPRLPRPKETYSPFWVPQKEQ